jgi:hypothetical protein
MADRYEAEAREVARRNGCDCGPCVAGIAAALRAAERRGAERMRERAAEACDFVAGKLVIGEVTFVDRVGIDTCAGLASRIRALPLEVPDGE